MLVIIRPFRTGFEQQFDTTREKPAKMAETMFNISIHISIGVGNNHFFTFEQRTRVLELVQVSVGRGVE